MPLLEAGAESAATTALPASMVSSFLCGVCVCDDGVRGAVWSDGRLSRGSRQIFRTTSTNSDVKATIP